jgi:hypothetical protein
MRPTGPIPPVPLASAALLVLLLPLSLAAQMDAPAAMQMLLRRVAANEVRFERARGNYTYRQDFSFFAYDRNRNPGGYYQVSTDITFTPDGRRFQKNIRGPVNALKIVRLTGKDFEDLRRVIPLVLTPAKLSQYQIRYLGPAIIALHDDQGRPTARRLRTRVFYLSPRQIWPGQRYFEGKIWVDPNTDGIVQLRGRPVPQIRRWVHGRPEENLFGRFTTYFARIDGRFWFPVYTHGDDWLGFIGGPVEMQEFVRFRHYQRFGTTSSFKVVGPAHQPPH